MKTCNANNCDYPVFSSGYCSRHQFLRSDSKYLALIERRKQKYAEYVQKGIKRMQSAVHKQTPLKTLKNAKKLTGEGLLFDTIWATRNHISFISDKSINIQPHTDFWYNCFIHVLAKGKYPAFILLDKNIILGLPEEHTLYDQGTEEQRKKYADRCENEGGGCDWSKLYSLAEELKTGYQKL